MMDQYIDRYEGPEFEPYVTALGKFALAWNDLQYQLGELFSIVTLEKRPSAGDSVNMVPERVWHAIKSDRSQRDMLEAALTYSNLAAGTALSTDGKWLCDRVGELENRRNDILHSPLMLHQYGASKTIMPNVYSGNPRAAALANVEDLLTEFRSARQYAILLSDYTQRLIMSLVNPQLSWPNRPSLQGRRPKGKPAAQRPASHK